jgi:hypothetical protein
MINSFYFIALISDRPINLDQGVFGCCQLVKPIVISETFSHTVFVDDQTNNLIKVQTIMLAA